MAVVQVERTEQLRVCHYCGGRTRVVWTRRAAIGSRSRERSGRCCVCAATYKEAATQRGNTVHTVATWYPPPRPTTA